MKRGIAFLAMVTLVALGVAMTSATASTVAGSPSKFRQRVNRPLCDEGGVNCTEVSESIGYEGAYTGHDEPSVLFYSDRPGSGNSNLYRFRLPTDPQILPKQDGSGGTFNFQLHPAFWLGMAMCDTESTPEYTHKCTPDSDTNIKNSPDPHSRHYIGKHSGTAFMEMQFYAPGWVPWPPGDSCDGRQWCAALNIDSLSINYNTGVLNNEDCLERAGREPVNFAFITRNGQATGPANPLDATAATYTPDPARDLFMKSGDWLTVDMHDTPAGFQVIINDLTSGQSGFMTASTDNGFGQVIFAPHATTCHVRPYAFHPMYSTSSPDTRVPWAAHSYNVAFSDEIGHFEYCKQVVEPGGACANSTERIDEESYCFPPSYSTRVKIGGCLDTDVDFDGPPYHRTWPGTLKDRQLDKALHPTSFLFSSPLFNGTENYSRVAFEADLPRIEASDFGGQCDRDTGENCVNPPPGAAFYPFYSTRDSGGACYWQLGGPYIPGTTKDFGGSSKAEFGPLLQLFYPGAGFTPVFRYNDFRNILNRNPCKA